MRVSQGNAELMEHQDHRVQPVNEVVMDSLDRPVYLVLMVNLVEMAKMVFLVQMEDQVSLEHLVCLESEGNQEHQVSQGCQVSEVVMAILEEMVKMEAMVHLG